MNNDLLAVYDQFECVIGNFPKLKRNIELKISKHMKAVSPFTVDCYHYQVVMFNVRRAIISKIVGPTPSAEKLVKYLNFVEERII